MAASLCACPSCRGEVKQKGPAAWGASRSRGGVIALGLVTQNGKAMISGISGLPAEGLDIIII